MSRKLTMSNGTVLDADDTPDRCPTCGKPVAHLERRGDYVAVVHEDHHLDCFKD